MATTAPTPSTAAQMVIKVENFIFRPQMQPFIVGLLTWDLLLCAKHLFVLDTAGVGRYLSTTMLRVPLPPPRIPVQPKMARKKTFRIGRSRTGLGLFATEPIKKGAFIVEYTGRKLTDEQADKLEARGNRYLYEINSRWTIDGKSRKNLGRYANHSCRPNAESHTIG